MKSVFWLFVLIVLSGSAYAQVSGAAASEVSCNAGNAENIGQHIIDWVLCGASFVQPQSTLFGALSLVINVACLVISIYMFLWSSFKWLYFTTSYGVPGGNGGKIHGGITILRTALLLSMLAPIVGNGFSPIQVLMRNFTETGKDIGDMAANVTANYVKTEGSIVNVDLQNIEEVTSQIIASKMCALMFDAHHEIDIQNGVIPEGTKTLSPIATVSGDKIKIAWTYADPYTYGWLDSQKSKISKYSSNGICGHIEFNIPMLLYENKNTQIHIEPEIGDQLNIYSTDEKLTGYIDIVTKQYQALQSHISNISNILDSTAADMIVLARVSSDKSQQDSSLESDIDAGHNQEVSLGTEIDNNLQNYIAQLLNANQIFKSQLIDIGKTAAKAVSLGDNIVSPDCNENISSSLSETLATQNTSLTHCVPNEAWQDQLERQGFAALGLYYMVHLTINKKIITLQKNLSEPSNMVPLFEDFDNLLTNKTIEMVATSPSSDVIYKRFHTILRGFQTQVTPSAFKMEFSSVENMGNTYSTEQSSTGLRKWIHEKISELIKAINSLLINQKDASGDIILKLMALGSIFLAVAQSIFAVIAVMAIGGLLLKVNPIARAINIVKHKTSKADEKQDSQDGDGAGGSLSKPLWYIGIGLFVLGGLLFYGLPAVPLFKWILEIQSWAIMMFMAFIYAPLWVMAHSSITDDRFLAEHTQSGYGMTYELILRPLLMVVSFYAMIKLMHIADLGFTMMTSYLIGIDGTAFSGLGFIFIFVISLFTALHLCFRCFDLISLLPDYIISRIGFGTRPLGDVANDKSHSNLIMMASRSTTSNITRAIGGVGDSIAGQFGMTAKNKLSPTPPTKS